MKKKYTVDFDGMFSTLVRVKEGGMTFAKAKAELVKYLDSRARDFRDAAEDARKLTEEQVDG